MTRLRWQKIREEIERADICINTESGYEIVRKFFKYFEAMEKLIVFENEKPEVSNEQTTTGPEQGQ